MLLHINEAATMRGQIAGQFGMLSAHIIYTCTRSPEVGREHLIMRWNQQLRAHGCRQVSRLALIYISDKMLLLTEIASSVDGCQHHINRQLTQALNLTVIDQRIACVADMNAFQINHETKIAVQTTTFIAAGERKESLPHGT